MQNRDSYNYPGGQPERRPGGEQPYRSSGYRSQEAPSQRPRPGAGRDSRQPQPRRQEPRQPTTQRGGGSRWVRAMLMVLITIGFCVFMAFFVLQTATDLFGLNQEDRTIEVTIPEGKTSIAEVGVLLKDAGVLDYAWVFQIYAGIKTEDGEFQPGTYMLNSNLGYDEIIVDLKSGTSNKVEFALTFREGRTVAEIARLLEEADVCKADDFLDYLEVADYDYEFFNAIPNDPLRFRKLEGYIFPDTYYFYEGEKVEDVVRKFIRNFNEKMTEELQAQMLEMDMSIDETIILASIIQREAGRVEDMRRVSSVFHNRLSLSDVYPRLQSDVTIFYVNNNIKPYLEEQNQEMYDAYNTYERQGLPVGAICNPGMDAIEAALNPAKTDYYFFVTDSEEEFYFAETADEHYRNVSTAMSVGGEAHGVDTQ